MARNNAAGGAGLLLGGLILASGLVSAEAHPGQLGVVNTREHPVTYPLGIMFLGLALLAIPFHFLKQPNIIAAILVGMAVGLTHLNEKMYLSVNTGKAMVDLGKLLWLFLSGTEVDVPGLFLHWRMVLINGMGQILLKMVVFCLIGSLTDTTSDAVSTAFFGLACTLSSTTLVENSLKARKDTDTMHGKIILGLMLLQDVSAVMAIALIPAFASEKSYGDVPATGAEDKEPFGLVIGRMFGIIAGLMLVLIALTRSAALDLVFRLFAVNDEMLFVGTFAFALGVPALMTLIPGGAAAAELGAFLAGMSTSALPYKVQIEAKIESIKSLGLVLFLFIFGTQLQLTFGAIGDALPMAVVIAFATVLALPTIMWLLGFIAGVDSRTAFMIGGITNQVSELSLILTAKASDKGLMDSSAKMIIALATLLSLALSAFVHTRLDQAFAQVRWMLPGLDRLERHMCVCVYICIYGET